MSFKCVFVFVFQQLLSLQEKLTSKEAELEQARDEHRYLEGEVLSLRDKVCVHTAHNKCVFKPLFCGYTHTDRG